MMFSQRVIVALLVGASVFFFDAIEAQPWGNFETIVNNWAKKFGASVGHQVEWVDAFCQHPHMKQHPDYWENQIDVEVIGEVKYYPPVSSVSKPSWTFNQWFHNSMTKPLKTKFHKIKEQVDQFTWSVDGNLVYGKDKIKKNFTFIIPPQLGLDRKNYTKEFEADEVVYGFNSKKTTIKYDKFNISQEITVPPGKSVQSTWVITEKDVTIPWSMDLEISGKFAVWFKTKWNGHWLWFFPVTRLADENSHFRRNGDTLRYTLEGSFSGVFSTNAQLYLNEYDLKKTHFRDIPIRH